MGCRAVGRLDGRVALVARTKIQMSLRALYFILPPPAVPESPLMPEPTPEGNAIPTDAEGCATSDDISPRNTHSIPFAITGPSHRRNDDCSRLDHL